MKQLTVSMFINSIENSTYSILPLQSIPAGYAPFPYISKKTSNELWLLNKAIPFLLPSLGRGLWGGVVEGLWRGCVVFGLSHHRQYLIYMLTRV